LNQILTLSQEYGLYIALEDADKFFKEWAGRFHEFWAMQDDKTAYARYLHLPANRTKLIDNEALLQGWSEKLFSSDDTAKLWKRVMKKKLAKGCELT
jgi:hypothetical protein